MSTRLTSENNQKSLKIKRCTLTYTDDWQQYLFIASLTLDIEVSIWKKKSKIWCTLSEHINKNRYCKNGEMQKATLHGSWKLTLWHADSLWTLEGVQLNFTVDATAHAFSPSGRGFFFLILIPLPPKENVATSHSVPGDLHSLKSNAKNVKFIFWSWQYTQFPVKHDSNYSNFAQL